MPETKRFRVSCRMGCDPDEWAEQQEIIEAHRAWIDGSGSLCLGDVDACGKPSLVRCISAGFWMQLWLVHDEQEEGEVGGAIPAENSGESNKECRGCRI